MAQKRYLQSLLQIDLPLWSIFCPLIGLLILLLTGVEHGAIMDAVMGISLIAVVLSAVHHAEVVAHKVGEPYGTLILALAITIIEVSLIVTIMLSEGIQGSTLARDTVFAAIMLILTGIIGLCLLLGGYRFKEQLFVKQGVSAAMVTLSAITILTLVLPNYTTSAAGPVLFQQSAHFRGHCIPGFVSRLCDGTSWPSPRLFSSRRRYCQERRCPCRSPLQPHHHLQPCTAIAGTDRSGDLIQKTIPHH